MTAFKKFGFVILISLIIGSLLSDAREFDFASLATSILPESKYDQGYQDGYDLGYQEGLEQGTSSGYSRGYKDGYNKASFESRSASSSVSNTVPNKSTATSWVYITNTGTKYHKAGCSYLKSSKQVSLSDAKAWGYEPCSRCY